MANFNLVDLTYLAILLLDVSWIEHLTQIIFFDILKWVNCCMLLLGVGVSNHFLRVWHHSKPKNAIYGKEHSQQVPLLYILTSIWVLCIQTLVEISLFHVFVPYCKVLMLKWWKWGKRAFLLLSPKRLSTYKRWSGLRNCFIFHFIKFS